MSKWQQEVAVVNHHRRIISEKEAARFAAARKAPSKRNSIAASQPREDLATSCRLLARRSARSVRSVAPKAADPATAKTVREAHGIARAGRLKRPQATPSDYAFQGLAVYDGQPRRLSSAARQGWLCGFRCRRQVAGHFPRHEIRGRCRLRGDVMSARHHLRHQYRQHRLERHESQHRHDRRPAWPDTVMAYAFLTALARWATAHHADPNARIMLPIGSVISRELHPSFARSQSGAATNRRGGPAT